MAFCWERLSITSTGPVGVASHRIFKRQLWISALWGIAALLPVACFLAALALRTIPTGDEPHYLVMTQSLLRDQDFDLRNNYEHKEYLEYYPSEINPHVIQVGNRWYPVHGIGLPILAAPWFAAGGRAGVVIMLTLMMLAGLGILWTVMRSAGFSRSATALAVLVAGFTLPVVSMSGQVYPEVPAFLLVSLGIRALVGSALTGWNLAALLLSVAVLPWLHSKDTALAIALLVATVLAHRQKGTMRVLAAPAGLLLVSVFGLVVLSHHWYRHWSLGPSIITAVTISGEHSLIAAAAALFAHPWVGLLGILFDQQSGILLASPVFVLAISGVMSLWSRKRTLAVGCLLTFLSVYLPNGAFSVWDGGFASPARLLTPAIPVLAIGVAGILDTGGVRAHRLFTWLAVPSFMHASLMMALPHTRYGDPMTHHNFFVAFIERHTHLDLTFLFPSFQTLTPMTWLTTGLYFVAIALICILVLVQNVPAPAASRS